MRKKKGGVNMISKNKFNAWRFAAGLFITLIFQANWVYSIPLPSNVSREFIASFEWTESEDFPAEYTNEVLISGSIEFTLINQIDHDWTTVDEVYWGFEGQACDGSLSFSGNFNNEMALEFFPHDATYVPWFADGSESIIIYEHLSGYNSSWGWPGSVFSGPDWNVINNENFLPTNMEFFVTTWEDTIYRQGRLDIALLPVPVPEPSTMFLVGIGLLGIVGLKKFFSPVFQKPKQLITEFEVEENCSP